MVAARHPDLEENYQTQTESTPSATVAIRGEEISEGSIARLMSVLTYLGEIHSVLPIPSSPPPPDAQS